jgi:adenine/guanine phosphoribosyltransferase-like PRPP-binding protein
MRKQEHIDSAGHLYHIIGRTSRHSTIKIAYAFLRPLRAHFDTIAMRGISGCIPGSILAYKLNKSIAIIRKPKSVESTHSRYETEGNRDCRTYLIVDDLVDTGQTIRDIILKMLHLTDGKARLYGLYLTKPAGLLDEKFYLVDQFGFTGARELYEYEQEMLYKYSKS